jgi:hypothetical protein
VSNSSHITRHRSLSREARGGFALLLTVTLLAFLVVLLVGLAAYTRVETAVAGNTQRQAQARQNALLALNVALGQLQKYAGPDQRVTATADAFGGVTGTKHFTGVWSSNPTATATPATPLTWLVSGNELSTAPLAVTPASSFTTTNSVELVGKNTSGTPSDVLAQLMPITTVGLPGATTATPATIGRYAWWIGDQGVKAPVALADPTSTAANFNYAPYTSAELLSRIRQQISLGAGAFDTTANTPVFEPRDTTGSPSNAALAANVTAMNQLAFFNKTSGGTVGLTTLQNNYHFWSPNNFNVLANTSPASTNIGLRQDLSLFSPTNPSPLGAAYDAWANYPSYLEAPVSGGATPPTPDYGSDPLRRRYKMTPWVSSQGIVQSVAPALSFFGISFSVRESATPPLMEVAVRCVIGLWNPYSAALVPEDLIVEVTSLPTIQIFDNAGGSSLPFSLQTVMAGDTNAPLQFKLPIPTDGVASDESSWLPGRVYDWSVQGNTLAPTDVNPMLAHHPSATGAGGSPSGIVRPTSIVHGTSPTSPAGSEMTRYCQSFGTTTLHIRLLRASDKAELATYDSLPFQVFGNGAGTTPMKIDYKYVDFAFVFRLPETDELPKNSTEKWLSAVNRDPRSPTFPTTGFIAGAKGDDPATYGGNDTSPITGFAIQDQERLLDRATNSFSYDEDVPVFELPRSPILSVGELQHLQLVGARPFAIGNSWGEAVQLNGINTGALFDQFFFSGLVLGVTPVTVGGSLMLPNPLLKPLPRNPATGSPVTLANLQNAPNAQSPKFLLQGGAFNLNSVNPTAWAAVLRAVRFPSATPFKFLDASFASGTADDATTAVATTDVAQFFRFSQSGQETYKADAGYAASTVAPPGPPDVASTANTNLFRQGMRTLTADQVKALAGQIVWRMQKKQKDASLGGPFRTLDEFLSPLSLFGGKSLLESAIAGDDATDPTLEIDLNTSVAEFSSQWLTQGDIMTALAPVLFPRSDTFVIRTYGEAANPTTNATEGRAWCEAIAQRVPDYFDSSAATGNAAEVAFASLNATNQSFGRRFKIISFRWLTRSDI